MNKYCQGTHQEVYDVEEDCRQHCGRCNGGWEMAGRDRWHVAAIRIGIDMMRR